MNPLFVICMSVSAILAALAAFYRPSNPAPPVNLLSLAVAFMALAFVLERVVGGA
jgi:hypothetical protein